MLLTEHAPTSGTTLGFTVSWDQVGDGGHDLDQSLHLLLFARDALGLEVDVDAINPPRLAGPVLGHRLLPDPGSTEAVASQWSWWWQSVSSPR